MSLTVLSRDLSISLSSTHATTVRSDKGKDPAADKPNPIGNHRYVHFDNSHACANTPGSSGAVACSSVCDCRQGGCAAAEYDITGGIPMSSSTYEGDSPKVLGQHGGVLEWPIPSVMYVSIKDPTLTRRRLWMALGVIVTVIAVYVSLGFIATLIRPPLISEGVEEGCQDLLQCKISAGIGWLCCGLAACFFLCVPLGVYVYHKKLAHIPARGRLPVWQFSLSTLGFALAFVDLAYFFLEEWSGGLYLVYDYMDGRERTPLRLLLAIAPGCLTAALTVVPVTSLLLRFVIIYFGRPRLCPPGWVSPFEIHTIRRSANIVPYVYLAVGIIPGVILFIMFSTTDYLIREIPQRELSDAWTVHIRLPVVIKWYRNILLATDIMAVGCLFIIRWELSLNDLDQTKILFATSVLLALAHFYFWYFSDYMMVMLWPKVILFVLVILQAAVLGYYYYSVVQVMLKKRQTHTAPRSVDVVRSGIGRQSPTDGSESCEECLPGTEEQQTGIKKGRRTSEYLDHHDI